MYLSKHDDLKHQKSQAISPYECNTSKIFLTSCCVVWILSGKLLVLTEITFSICMYKGTTVNSNWLSSSAVQLFFSTQNMYSSHLDLLLLSSSLDVQFQLFCLLEWSLTHVAWLQLSLDAKTVCRVYPVDISTLNISENGEFFCSTVVAYQSRNINLFLC